MLELQNFVIKEQVAFLKTVDVYDIFDPNTQQQVGVAREEPGSMIKTLRWFISKKLMPTWVEVRKHPGDELIFTLHKPFTWFQAIVNVLDGQGKRIGYFKARSGRSAAVSGSTTTATRFLPRSKGNGMDGISSSPRRKGLSSEE